MNDLTYDQLNLLQKMIVRKAHPINFALQSLALIWGGYFLWNHHVVLSLVFLLGLPIIGEVFVLGDSNYMETVKVGLNLFQRLLVYHTEKINLALHLVAFVTWIIGMWQHRGLMIIISLSCSLMGHVLAWTRHARDEAQYSLAIGDDHQK